MWLLNSDKRIILSPKTSIQCMADEETQNRYSQLNSQIVDKLLIKFFKKGVNNMPEVNYVIVEDDGDKIKYNRVEEHEVSRETTSNYRKRLEALKEQKANIENEIAELEKLIEESEYIVKLADDKKSEEAVEEEAVEEENSVADAE